MLMLGFRRTGGARLVIRSKARRPLVTQMVRPPKIGPDLPLAGSRAGMVYMQPADESVEVLESVMADWYKSARAEWYAMDPDVAARDQKGIICAELKRTEALGDIAHPTAGKSWRALDWRVLQARAYELARCLRAGLVALHAAYLGICKASARVDKALNRPTIQADRSV